MVAPLDEAVAQASLSIWLASPYWVVVRFHVSAACHCRLSNDSVPAVTSRLMPLRAPVTELEPYTASSLASPKKPHTVPEPLMPRRTLIGRVGRGCQGP